MKETKIQVNISFCLSVFLILGYIAFAVAHGWRDYALLVIFFLFSAALGYHLAVTEDETDEFDDYDIPDDNE